MCWLVRQQDGRAVHLGPSKISPGSKTSPALLVVVHLLSGLQSKGSPRTHILVSPPLFSSPESHSWFPPVKGSSLSLSILWCVCFYSFSLFHRPKISLTGSCVSQAATMMRGSSVTHDNVLFNPNRINLLLHEEVILAVTRCFLKHLNISQIYSIRFTFHWFTNDVAAWITGKHTHLGVMTNLHQQNIVSFYSLVFLRENNRTTQTDTVTYWKFFNHSFWTVRVKHFILAITV